AVSSRGFIPRPAISTPRARAAVGPVSREGAAGGEGRGGGAAGGAARRAGRAVAPSILSGDGRGGPLDPVLCPPSERRHAGVPVGAKGSILRAAHCGSSGSRAERVAGSPPTAGT